MPAPAWQSATLYPKGYLVTPATQPEISTPQVSNGKLQGAAGWTFEGAAYYDAAVSFQAGSGSAALPGNAPSGFAVNNTKLFIPVGTKIGAKAQINQGAAIANATKGWVQLRFYDEDDVELQRVDGNQVTSSSGGAWKSSSIPQETTLAPAGTSYAKGVIALYSVADHTHPVWGDNLEIQTSYKGAADGLVYRAVQEIIGTSAATEPAWPTVLGQQVIDNTVIWEAVQGNRIVYKAIPIMRTGETEPEWPATEGGTVADGTVLWTATSRRIEDEKCPHSKFTILLASKVYMGDGDIVAYCATNNPRDWSTANDAGYLPTHLNLFGGNPVMGLSSYRTNLIVFNAEGFQMWQVDPDPALSSFLDAMPIGSTEHWAASPIGNDEFFLSAAGVRSISIAAASTNLDAGDVGSPIDRAPHDSPLSSLMDDYRAAQALGIRVRSKYNPGKGRYMIWFNVPGTHPVIGAYGCRVWSYTRSKTTKVSGWSQYLFPRAIDEIEIDGNELLVRSADSILEFDTNGVMDFEGATRAPANIEFDGLIWTPYVDAGQPGANKMVQELDFVSEGAPSVSFGYNQSDWTQYTSPYLLPADSVSWDRIPYELTAASVSVRLRYTGGQKWRFLAMNLYIDQRK